MKERAEMQKKIDELETSEQDLKNQVENFFLNNAQLIDDVEKMRIENAELKRMLNDMEISGQIKRLNQVYRYYLELLLTIFKQHESEKEEWKIETRKMGEKMEALELNLIKEIEKKQDLGELEMMRHELGDIGGAGHFFGNDRMIKYGGMRDAMGGEELKKVLRLLAAGEKKVNLKEKEFRTFLIEKIFLKFFLKKLKYR